VGSISPTAALISSTGISAPSFAAILTYLQGQYGSIFGSDAVLTPDTQDGQLLGVICQAISDANSAAINCYQSFSPLTAQGTALSVNVAINGIQRQQASYSTAPVELVGVAYTVIPNGVITDQNGNNWSLPSSVTIGSGGTVSTTATCQTLGAITAPEGTITVIGTPTLGWQSVTNTAAASAGQPVQTDAQLRQLQAASTTLPSLGVMDGIVGAIWNVPGVTAVASYTNPTSTTNADGLPAGAISLVVEGGSASAIAQAIATKKTPGVPTYGSTSVNVTVAWSSSPLQINFQSAAQQAVRVSVTLNPLTGYTSAIGTEIQNAVANYINSLGIGQNVMIPRLYVPAQLAGPFGTAAAASANDGLTYEITQIQLAVGSGSFASSDITIPWNYMPTCTPSSVTITT
jgi:uncharacterized phage protein gp47/JayE